jgi:hypothetical protein
MIVPYNDHAKLVKQISKEKGLDKRVVNAICHHSLGFTADVIRDVNNLRPVRWRYLAVLAMMKNKKKK